MLDSAEPEYKMVETPRYNNPLPEWGGLILDYIAPRMLVDVKTITRACFPSGNRTGRKKLIQLTISGFLNRYEISTSQRSLITYSLGLEGMRYTKYMSPDLDILKAQELIIANEFCAINDVSKFIFNPSKSLTIGQINFGGTQYSLWCPRVAEKPKRIKSLQNEIPLSSQGLMVVAPSLRYIYTVAPHMYGLYVPVYFCIDTILNRFMRLDNEVLIPI